MIKDERKSIKSKNFISLCLSEWFWNLQLYGKILTVFPRDRRFLNEVGFILKIFGVFRSVDNSEWMRNGDFLPTRLQAQQDAVSLVCHSKTRQNPENNVGLMTLARWVREALMPDDSHSN